MMVNERIRQARKALNMTQPDFAKTICISKGYIAELENAHRVANDRIIQLISLTFGISEAWLKEGTGEMFYKSPDEKLRRMISLFNELPSKFQDYVIIQIETLLKTTKED
jgi:transcriptional regulator with XRE-family HTH domain